MFNKYTTVINSSPAHQHITVKEHRAPTDESVRLLREMEQSARDKVTQAIRLENSPIDCVVHVQENLMTSDRDYCVFVKVNGKRLEVRKSFAAGTSDDGIAAGLLEAISNSIACNILARAFTDLPRHLRFKHSA